MNQEWLFSATACEWEEISPFKADYYTKAKGYPQYCVLTFDHPNKSLKPLYFAPKNNKAVRDPNHFVELTNAKKQIINKIPAIQIDLDDLAAFSFSQVRFNTVIKGTVSFTGSIKLSRIGSFNSMVLSKDSFSTISHEAKLQCASFLSTITQTIEINMETRSIGFKEKVAGSSLQTTVLLEPPNKISAELSPATTIPTTILNKWHIEGEIGYKLEAEFENKDPSQFPFTSTMPEKEKQAAITVGGAELAPEISAWVIRATSFVVYAVEFIAVAWAAP